MVWQKKIHFLSILVSGLLSSSVKKFSVCSMQDLKKRRKKRIFCTFFLKIFKTVVTFVLDAMILSMYKSNFRHKDFRSLSIVLRNAHGTNPPLIMKCGGLESSAQIIISSNGKTKRKSFYFVHQKKRKDIFKILR